MRMRRKRHDGYLQMKQAAENDGWQNGKIIAICTAVEFLSIEMGWKEDKIMRFSNSLLTQLKESSQVVLDCAIKPWHDNISQRIADKLPKEALQCKVNSPLKKLEYDARNTSYLTYCSYIFLNLFSNFELSSNNKGTGTLDALINYCVDRFADFMKDSQHFSNRNCLEECKNKTGIRIA